MADQSTPDRYDREEDIVIAIVALLLVGAAGATWFFLF